MTIVRAGGGNREGVFVQPVDFGGGREDLDGNNLGAVGQLTAPEPCSLHIVLVP